MARRERDGAMAIETDQDQLNRVNLQLQGFFMGLWVGTAAGAGLGAMLVGLALWLL